MSPRFKGQLALERREEQNAINKQAQDAWCDWLSDKIQPDTFITSTFGINQRTKSSITAVRKVERILGRAYKFYASPYRGFIASEPHQSGFYHVHGVLRLAFSPASDHGLLAMDRKLLKAYLGKVLGHADVQEIKEIGGVVGYVTKYCTKTLTDWLIL